MTSPKPDCYSADFDEGVIRNPRRPKPGEPQVTHHPECWRDPKHHACAVAKVEGLTADLDNMLNGGVHDPHEQLDALWEELRAENAKLRAKVEAWEDPLSPERTELVEQVVFDLGEGNRSEVELREGQVDLLEAANAKLRAELDLERNVSGQRADERDAALAKLKDAGEEIDRLDYVREDMEHGGVNCIEAIEQNEEWERAHQRWHEKMLAAEARVRELEEELKSERADGEDDRHHRKVWAERFAAAQAEAAECLETIKAVRMALKVGPGQDLGAVARAFVEESETIAAEAAEKERERSAVSEELQSLVERIEAMSKKGSCDLEMFEHELASAKTIIAEPHLAYEEAAEWKSKAEEAYGVYAAIKAKCGDALCWARDLSQPASPVPDEVQAVCDFVYEHRNCPGFDAVTALRAELAEAKAEVERRATPEQVVNEAQKWAEAVHRTKEEIERLRAQLQAERERVARLHSNGQELAQRAVDAEGALALAGRRFANDDMEGVRLILCDRNGRENARAALRQAQEAEPMRWSNEKQRAVPCDKGKAKPAPHYDCEVVSGAEPDEERCPRCGYTEEDKRFHGDHYLCSEEPTCSPGEFKAEPRKDGEE